MDRVKNIKNAVLIKAGSMKKYYNYEDLGEGFFDSLVEKAKELINPKRVILFGSFARGDAGKKSDLDIAFDFEDGKWSELYWWIEEDFRTLRELDLVDMRTADKELLESIEKEGVILYER